MADSIRAENHGPVRIITLNRPQVLNALNARMRAELAEALSQPMPMRQSGGVVLTGAGERAFAAGQDLNEAMNFTPDRARAWIEEFDVLYSALRRLDKPCIAALNDAAVGAGLQVALLADLRVAAAHARCGDARDQRWDPRISGTWILWPI